MVLNIRRNFVGEMKGNQQLNIDSPCTSVTPKAHYYAMSVKRAIVTDSVAVDNTVALLTLTLPNCVCRRENFFLFAATHPLRHELIWQRAQFQGSPWL
jgi:hypothetical protein